MHAEKKIYFVKPKRYTQQFIGGFKNDACLEIIDGILNPDLISDQQQSAYYISLEQTNSIPRDIFMCDQNCEVEETKNEEHNICFYGGSESRHGLFISKVFADSEEQALRKVIDIRNETIVNGEWDLAWEKHKLHLSRLNKKGKQHT
ncbi:hypothetical protein [Pedobacter gandavensis]|uniref:DUF695 domain-containing protein n=1 Tax=Pedobacter gandavensis TaxID=2679963 RepID=A0ABR6ETE4_9SPHI|nr:hypothetical protein [Pedobacter gandavensis]MBB2148481.1 hypothetical protein [Pedobacter gandavensis]